MLWPAREARQDQKWWIGIMSHRFGRIRRYYASRTSHDVVVAHFRLRLQRRAESFNRILDQRPGHLLPVRAVGSDYQFVYSC